MLAISNRSFDDYAKKTNGIGGIEPGNSNYDYIQYERHSCRKKSFQQWLELGSLVSKPNTQPLNCNCSWQNILGPAINCVWTHSDLVCGHSHYDSHIACIQTDADPSLAKACLMLARRVCANWINIGLCVSHRYWYRLADNAWRICEVH